MAWWASAPARPRETEESGSFACIAADPAYPDLVTPPRVSVHQLFALLERSIEGARTALGADHVLVPLEPWTSSEDSVVTAAVTLTGRAHLVTTGAGRQVPVLAAACVPLTGNVPLPVGRTSKATITIDQPTISRLHAELRPTAAGFALADKGSYNGTMVNNRVLEQGEVVILKEGDVVVFGEAQLVYGTLGHLAAMIKQAR